MINMYNVIYNLITKSCTLITEMYINWTYGACSVYLNVQNKGDKFHIWGDSWQALLIVILMGITVCTINTCKHEIHVMSVCLQHPHKRRTGIAIWYFNDYFTIFISFQYFNYSYCNHMIALLNFSDLFQETPTPKFYSHFWHNENLDSDSISWLYYICK